MEMLALSTVILIYSLVVRGSDEGHENNIEYRSPSLKSDNIFYSEHFDDIQAFNKKWVESRGKKSQSDGSVVGYDGIWELEPAVNNPLPGDLGLVLKTKAKHAAISSKLKAPFEFKSSPFIVQYEVSFQDGQECGGAYLKLLSEDKGSLDLIKFHDLTPYSIMFGPDKCGNDHKLHFIFKHRNPRNGSVEEKHAKKASSKLDDYFSDMKPHLYTLILRPDNTFQILVDHNVVNEGSLLTDFNPPVNPPAEIDDPTDLEPADWDNREKIPDPAAKKPDDWDEDAPATIPDPSAVKPDGWLTEEPTDIKDPTAEKPQDWDEEMDGEWEAPLIPNPLCQDAPGCGVWSPSQIPNPSYKGKWYPPLIENPDYRGTWTPRKIPNPTYFEDKNPFQMTTVGAVGFELWSMSSNIYFDNIIVTSSEEMAKKWASLTFDVKKKYFEKNEDSLFNRIINYTNQYPWLWALYIILLLIPTVLGVLFCFGTTLKDKEEQDVAVRKKTDETELDDEGLKDDAEFDQKSNENLQAGKEENKDVSEDEADNAPDENPEEDDEKPATEGKSSPRRRRVRAD